PAHTLRSSTWLFPGSESCHLLGFGLTAGAVLVIELPLLGFGIKEQPVATLAANAEPWLLGSIVLMFASGIPLAMSEAMKAYYSFAFWVKMTSLFLVLLYTFTLRRRITRNDLILDRPRRARVMALMSLTLWFGVAW